MVALPPPFVDGQSSTIHLLLATCTEIVNASIHELSAVS